MITVNGHDLDVETGCSIAKLVDEQLGGDRGVAVALNGTVVPRSQWRHSTLADGDHLDLLLATQGG